MSGLVAYCISSSVIEGKQRSVCRARVGGEKSCEAVAEVGWLVGSDVCVPCLGLDSAVAPIWVAHHSVSNQASRAINWWGVIHGRAREL